MTEEQRKRLLKIREILDGMIDEVGATSESAFNTQAAKINKISVAMRAWRADEDYKRGDIRIDPNDGVPYWAIHDNGVTSGQVHQPSTSPTIWTHCHGTSPETARPFLVESYNPYMTGHYCIENGTVYKCKQDNMVYSPSVLPSAWEKAGAAETQPSEETPETEIPEWVMPASDKPYGKGAIVKHLGKVWENTIDNNVWEPGVYGWVEKEV